VDHYSLDARWESVIKTAGFKILVIDDLADRPHSCDILLDQNLWPDLEFRYENLVPEGTLKLLGPKYALLKREFNHQRKKTVPSKKNQIMVFFGGADITGECNKLISALKHLRQRRMKVKLITGKANPNTPVLLKSGLEIPLLEVSSFISNMAEEMCSSCYAIGASGTSNWERFCMGLNASIVATAENQVGLANYLSELKIIDYLGPAHEVTPDHYTSLLMRLEAGDWPVQQRETIMTLVDGLGTYRLLEHIMRGSQYETKKNDKR
jgi:UDP-2,4-diacetamido-2,4,6-trideoxy-beta-L-altropyranose hydrolase